MKFKFTYIHFPLFLFLLAGCATIKKDDVTGFDIQEELLKTKRAQSEINLKLDELNNNLLILEGRVDDNRRTMDELKRMAVPISQPEGLKVVKLTEPKLQKGGTGIKEGAEGLLSGIKQKPQTIYIEAQELFRGGKREEAIKAFEQLVEEYPHHNLSDNALYQVGVIYYSGKKYTESIAAFKRIISDYRDGNMAPYALLKIAYAYTKLDRNDEAKDTLTTLINRFPDSEAAKEAREMLKKTN